MSYTKLAIDSATPKRIQKLIKSLDDHYFSDVHTMLRLPQPSLGLTAGCNFAIAQVLAAVVSGASVTLYKHQGGKGVRFTGLLREFYPWSSEPGNAVTPEEGAKVIYNLVRNPLTHDLGLDLENRRPGQKTLLKRLATDNKKTGLPEEFVEQLEGPGRPSKLSPTVRIISGDTVVLIEAFYWGVRRMIVDLSATNQACRLRTSFSRRSRREKEQ